MVAESPGRPAGAAQPARLVVAADPFDQTLDFFTGQLGFRVDVISPADDPDRATVSRHGMNVVLDRYAATTAGSGVLELPADAANPAGATVTAPNGTLVRFVGTPTASQLPDLEPSLVVSINSDSSSWVTGRAGMQYRDLIPNRLGGRFIASHIKVPGSGPVPDWVHHHDIRFQIIYCRSGAGTLVYEDQGEPFRFEAGDCVLQPPGIRHRVLETFDDMEVIELGCPARHDTFADHDMELPTGRLLPDRDYNGQRFVHFRAAGAEAMTTAAEPWTSVGWQVVDTGIARATDGVGSVRMITSNPDTSDPGTAQPATSTGHNGDLLFLYVLEGAVTLAVGGDDWALAADDSAAVPPDTAWSLVADTAGPSAPRVLEITTVQFES